MRPEDREHLARGAAQLGVDLDAHAIERLDRYVALLLAWNAKVNLTAVTEVPAIIDKHLLDSLALVPHIDGGRVLDVGTGPGLPAVVLAIARPGTQVTAVESIHKKVAFVRAVSRELGLGLTVEATRLEARTAPADFDIAVSRATFEPSEWVARGATLVRPGGRLIAMLSAQQSVPAAPGGYTAEEMVEHSIGGALRRIARYRRS